MKCLQMSVVSVTTASSSDLLLFTTLYPSHAFSFPLQRQFQPLSFSSALLRRLPPCRAASPGPPLPPSDKDSSHLKGSIHRFFSCLIIRVRFSCLCLYIFIIHQVYYGCSIAGIFFPVTFRVRVVTLVIDLFFGSI